MVRLFEIKDPCRSRCPFSSLFSTRHLIEAVLLRSEADNGTTSVRVSSGLIRSHSLIGHACVYRQIKPAVLIADPPLLLWLFSPPHFPPLSVLAVTSTAAPKPSLFACASNYHPPVIPAACFYLSIVWASPAFGFEMIKLEDNRLTEGFWYPRSASLRHSACGFLNEVV